MTHLSRKVTHVLSELLSTVVCCISVHVRGRGEPAHSMRMVPMCPCTLSQSALSLLASEGQQWAAAARHPGSDTRRHGHGHAHERGLSRHRCHVCARSWSPLREREWSCSCVGGRPAAEMRMTNTTFDSLLYGENPKWKVDGWTQQRNNATPLFNAKQQITPSLPLQPITASRDVHHDDAALSDSKLNRGVQHLSGEPHGWRQKPFLAGMARSR